MLIYLTLLVAVVGLLMYVLASAPPNPNALLAEIGRIMFFCGLLAFLLDWAPIIIGKT